MKYYLDNVIPVIDLEKLMVIGTKVFVTFVVGLILYKLFRRSVKRLETRMIERNLGPDGKPSEIDKRIQTLLRLMRQAVSIGIWIVVVLVMLTEMGIDIRPVLAGAGIAGLAVGFGAQNLVRDLISGFFMILENQVRVGDVVIINGTSGTVERINLRTVVLRDLADVVHVFPNGSINTLANMTKEMSAYVFDIGVAYREDTDKVVQVMQEVLDSIVADAVLGREVRESPEIFGVNSFGESGIVIKGRIRTVPGSQWTVGREFLRRLKVAFDREGIEIPYPHRTLYFGNDSNSPAFKAGISVMTGRDS